MAVPLIKKKILLPPPDTHQSPGGQYSEDIDILSISSKDGENLPATTKSIFYITIVLNLYYIHCYIEWSVLGHRTIEKKIILWKENFPQIHMNIHITIESDQIDSG